MNTRIQNILIASGIPVIVVALVVLAFASLIGFAIRGHRAAERAGNEAATNQNLKTIAALETRYFNSHNRRFATFQQLVDERILDSRFAGNSTVVDGYTYTLNLTAAPSAASSYEIRADPLNPSTGTKHFYLDSESSQIHINLDGPAGSGDPAN